MVICSSLFGVFQCNFFRQVRCLFRVPASGLEPHWSVPTFGGRGSYFLDSSINSVTIVPDEKGPNTWMGKNLKCAALSVESVFSW